jgi:selenocysteine lyase/cysteine desulfurase
MLYLNCAGLSVERPESKEAATTVQAQFETMLFSELGVRWYTSQLDRCRRIIQDFLRIHKNTADPNVVFVANATTALQIILSNIDLVSGDVVLASDQEHPRILRSLMRLQRRGVGLQLIGGESEDDFCHNLEQALSKHRARLLIVSHVAHTDGRVFPLGRIGALAKAKHIMVAVDGTQAAGHIPIDLRGSDQDFYFFSGHKWCCGPLGTGILLVTENYITRNSIFHPHSREIGTIQHDFELGTQRVGLIAGLARACELRKDELPAATTSIQRLRDELLTPVRSLHGARLRRWEGAHAPGICTLQLESDRVSPSLLTEYLLQHDGIVIKPFAYPERHGLIRLSYSHSTSESDIRTGVDRLAKALIHFNGS